MAIHAETFFLDERAGGTLQLKIKRFIVEAILSGRFGPGERMPSSRALARHLGVSRITVTLAYTDLVADDYLTARGRSGYFVSQSAPVAPRLPAPELRLSAGVDWSRFLSQRSDPTGSLTRPEDWQNYPYPFIYGQADPSLFDSQNWRLCALQALGRKDFDALTSDQYDRDDPILVDFIRRHILPRRGIRAEADEILITMGAQNALWLAAQLLLTQRRTAAVENPGYPGLKDILAQTRCHLVHVDVDEEGLPPEALPDSLDVLFVTVSHQCPTNVTMPVGRRQKLLGAAAARGFVIVEDDYEFELSFERSPLPSLRSIDDTAAVIHVGSFSKSLFPGLRLGYLVAPAPFVAEARRLRGTVIRHPPGLVQRTAANFLSLGHYDSQIKRMRAAFQRRRSLMQTAIDEAGLTHAGEDPGGGSCFWMRAPEHIDTRELALRLEPRGVVIEPGDAFFHGADPPRHFYRLAYSSIASVRIPRGIEIISEVIGELD